MLRLPLLAALLLLGLSPHPTLSQDMTPKVVPAPPPRTGSSLQTDRAAIIDAARSYCQQLSAGIAHADALAEACEFSMSIQYLMPDYLCTQTMKPEGPPHYQIGAPQLEITAEVGLQNGRESYSDIRVNGKPANLDFSSISFGSVGEFGSLLRAIFHPQNKAQFTFVKDGHLRSTPALLFEFTVHQENNKSLWFLRSRGKTFYPGYHGSMWLDKTTFRILRLEMKAIEMEKAKIPFSQFNLTTDYADTPLGDGTSFVLPVQTETRGCTSEMACLGNSLHFSNCRKFAAKSRILPTP